VEGVIKSASKKSGGVLVQFKTVVNKTEGREPWDTKKIHSVNDNGTVVYHKKCGPWKKGDRALDRGAGPHRRRERGRPVPPGARSACTARHRDAARVRAVRRDRQEGHSRPLMLALQLVPRCNRQRPRRGRVFLVRCELPMAREDKNATIMPPNLRWSRP